VTSMATPPTRINSYITTSWDDGHAMDMRVAELLSKYRLPGTFYIPRRCEVPVMGPSQMRDLGAGFEIGAHTLSHAILEHSPADIVEREVVQSKAWLEDITGVPCRVFCPPQGRFKRRDVKIVKQAGFKGMRTTELLSLQPPSRDGALSIIPTTVQARRHERRLYARNFVKRGAFRNAWRFAASGANRDWLELSRFCLKQTIEQGGVFHLWGHSWEIEQNNEWGRLESVLQILSAAAAASAAVTNGELCDLA
jgi:peptidoglycan-N-acetylglucosamine deacetylase